MSLIVAITIFCFSSLAFCQQTSGNGPVANFTDANGRTALLWTSIAIAVLTSLLQGLIVTIVNVAEDQSMWTFRFRIARLEHWWWLVISTLLFVSFSLIVLSFLAGNNNDSVSVLALSTATTIAIVRYAMPAWRNRRFIENRWLAWTGNSRTAIRAQYKEACGDENWWFKMANAKAVNKIQKTASDDWGFAIWPWLPTGLWQDPTALLDQFGEDLGDWTYSTVWPLGPCIYDDGLEAETGDVSLLWGENVGFRRRVSRAINSMPAGLLKSHPFTVDGYNGEGLCLAFGILGRNKGLRPAQLVFDFQDKLKQQRGIIRNKPNHRITTELENSSAWSPRPNKVMRSYYTKAVDEQFGTLPLDFRGVAAEIALIFLDIRERPLRTWLLHKLDQQSINVNRYMSGRPLSPKARPKATPTQLHTLYRASYTSMVISLNYFAPGGTTKTTRTNTGIPVRPDLLCFALLWLADHAVEVDPATGRYRRGQGVPAPDWWGEDWVRDRLAAEYGSLKEGFREPTAWLLGLKGFPPELDLVRHPDWPTIVYDPVYTA
jgi:hypothetical protein